MRGFTPLVLGIVGTLAFSWLGLAYIPNFQIGHLDPQTEEDGSDAYPVPKSGMAECGRRVYIANGCFYCHSQQVRADYAASDIERKWGDRRSAPRDYIFDRPVLLGKMRIGPDLTNIGKRAPVEQESPAPSASPAAVGGGAAAPPGATPAATPGSAASGGSPAATGSAAPAQPSASTPGGASPSQNASRAATPATSPAGSPAAAPPATPAAAPAATAAQNSPAPETKRATSAAPPPNPPASKQSASPASSAGAAPSSAAPPPVQQGGSSTAGAATSLTVGSSEFPPLYSAAWHHRHLYSPRSLNIDSSMPAYKFLYEKRRVGGQPAADAVKLTGDEAPGEGWEIVPTYDAKCLVAYLMSLDQSHALKEVKSAAGPATSAAAASPPPAQAKK